MEKLASNEEILKEVEKLVKSIKESDKYKEYISIRDKLKQDDEIIKKISLIKKLQQEYVKSAYLDKSLEDKITIEKEALQNNTLYQEYLSSFKSLNSDLIMIKEGLNFVFTDLLNNFKIDK